MSGVFDRFESSFEKSEEGPSSFPLGDFGTARLSASTAVSADECLLRKDSL